MKKKKSKNVKKLFNKKIHQELFNDRLCFYLTNLQKYATKAELVEKTKPKTKACLSEINSLISNKVFVKQMEQIIEQIKQKRNCRLTN